MHFAQTKLHWAMKGVNTTNITAVGYYKKYLKHGYFTLLILKTILELVFNCILILR